MISFLSAALHNSSAKISLLSTGKSYATDIRFVPVAKVRITTTAFIASPAPDLISAGIVSLIVNTLSADAANSAILSAMISSGLNASGSQSPLMSATPAGRKPSALLKRSIIRRPLPMTDTGLFFLTAVRAFLFPKRKSPPWTLLSLL